MIVVVNINKYEITIVTNIKTSIVSNVQNVLIINKLKQ